MKTENIAESLQPLIREVGSYHPDPINARTGHDLEGIAQSLLEYGQLTPIVANMDEDGRIIKGNGTYMAATKVLGWERIAVVEVRVDESTATGYALADNRLGDRSGFDPLMLAKAMQQAEDHYTGFTAKQAATIAQALTGPPAPAPRREKRPDHICPACGYEWDGS